ncbi:MAG: amidohydrolase [Rhodospirillaceae bacterium]|nr:amidohydrolase [Rhodospirillaceae bacterium]
MRIATEEAFATPALIGAWRKLLDDGAPGESGFKLLIGFFLNPGVERAAIIGEQLLDLGELRLKHMDEGGVDKQLIFITSPGVQVFAADLGRRLAEEANDILSGAVRAHPDRFDGLAAIAPQAPDDAAKELERAKGLGLKGVVINSHTKGEYLDNAAYRPILEAAESLGMPIYIHPRNPPPSMLQPFAERHLERSLWGFQTETALHALRMIVSGVFDDFPKLKIVLGHLGEGLPFWLDRIDRHFSWGANSGDTVPFWTAKRPPGEYFLENFYIPSSGHNWDPAVRFVEEVVGEDRLMFAVDYPYENCRAQVDQAGAITLKNPEKFYHLNAERVFKLN